MKMDFAEGNVDFGCRKTNAASEQPSCHRPPHPPTTASLRPPLPPADRWTGGGSPRWRIQCLSPSLARAPFQKVRPYPCASSPCATLPRSFPRSSLTARSVSYLLNAVIRKADIKEDQTIRRRKLFTLRKISMKGKRMYANSRMIRSLSAIPIPNASNKLKDLSL